MSISKEAIQDYLDREPESKAWVKTLRPLEVEFELGNIKPPPNFTIPSFRVDQKICFVLGVAYPEILFMTDLGLGKTGLSLELLSYFYDNKFIRRAFVFCPTNEVADGWVDEIEKWQFKIPYLLVTDRSSKAKWKTVTDFTNGIVIGTYMGIAAMVADLQLVIDKRTGKPEERNGKPTDRRSRQIVKAKLDELTQGVDAVVFDQSTKLGNRDSLSFKVCNKFADTAQIRYGLAGRAFGRDPFMLWSQFYVVDRGVALGRHISMYREAFWWREETPWGDKWHLRKRREKKLGQRISASSIRYAVDECLELPAKVPPIVRKFDVSDDTWTYYMQEADKLVKARGNYREVKNAFLRMRQISSGFVGFIDDDTGERAQIEFRKNPKLDMTLAWLDEIPEDRKVLIYHVFTHSGHKLCEALDKAGYRHGWLWGGTKDWAGIKTAFNTDPNFRVLVLNTAKGAMGLNLQVANYTIFYESPATPIDRYECEGRTFRDGQQYRPFYFDPVMRDSVDEDILLFHAEGNDLQKSLVENPERFLRRRNRRT